MSDSHARTTSATACSCVTVRLGFIPSETSVVRRMWARRGANDLGSTQARMMSSPVRVLATAHRAQPSVTAALRVLRS
jgi:hypothetical protein